MTSVGSGRTFSVTVPEAGTYPVNVRYANGIHPYTSLRAKNVSLHVNGQDLGQWNFPTTGSWKDWGVQTRDLDLQAGVNTITLAYEAGDEGNINIDVLSIGENPDICTPGEVEDGYTALFDGTLASLQEGWRMAGPGGFGRQEDCSIQGAGGMGLLWYNQELGDSYSLKLDWKLLKDDNGGVFVGFPNPGDDPWVAVNKGYEIQIDATDAADRTTGAIYTFQGADAAAVEASLKPVGQWNAYDIRVEGDRIRVYLNDVLVNDFTSSDPARLVNSFVGIQNHGNGEMVNYRNIRFKELTDEARRGARDLDDGPDPLPRGQGLRRGPCHERRHGAGGRHAHDAVRDEDGDRRPAGCLRVPVVRDACRVGRGRRRAGLRDR